ncbi:hypothetical protein DOY81_004658 [Sarcophaga bullata]|nr:hypothetical protein DOY81_004658 [Sarcophaga bullata]
MNYKEFTNLIYNSSSHQGIRNETFTLKIFNCPLPDDGNSLTDMFNKLGIIYYHELMLKSNDKYLRLTKHHFRNIRDLTRLTLDLKIWNNLPENLFEDVSLKSLQTLDLYTNASFIPGNIFNNLENLISLKLGFNVESLGYEVFRKQTKLKTLNLAHNKLKHLHPNVFKTNVQLFNLYLQNNSLQSLPQDIFKSLTMLRTLNINENKFQYLPTKLLENNDKIREFTLTKNYFTILKLSDFFLFDVEKLEKVAIQCVFENLEENVFFNSSSINTIVLNHNHLEFLPKNLLQHQQKLLKLDLSYNHLKALPDGFFDNSKEIRSIKLSHNYLTTIESTAFADLPQLQLLDLSDNRLNSIDFTPELQTNYNLETINLKNNSISDLQIFHKHLPRHLKTLDLSFNQVQWVIGKNFELLYTDNLILNLTHNRIYTIKIDDFGNYNRLKTLSVTVDFNQNPLKCDCDLWGMKMAYLNDSMNTNLKFYSNNLKCAEPEGLQGRFFQDLNESEILCPVQWKYADFQQCPKQCKCSFRPLDVTLIIDCTRKNLTQLPNITNIRNYEFKAIEFNLSMNFINQLPTRHAEDDYPYKTQLILCDNNLTSINKNQIPLNVTVLDVRKNLLTYLDVDTLSFMNSSQRLRQIRLTDNNWLCDCSPTSRALFMFTHRNMEKFKDALQMTCFNYDTPLKYVHDIPAICHSNDLLYTLIGLSVALIFLILAWKYQIEIKYWFYDHNLCPSWLTPLPDEYSEEQFKYDAFISYSHHDEKFIVNYLVPELENVAPKFKLCIHTRDFLVGDYIPDQIIRCIAESRRVIVVLSKHFLQSEWSKLEFKEACRSNLKQRNMKIIVIMYEDLGDINNYDKEFEKYLKLNTYLKWGDPQFWKKLRRAMPHKLK